MEIMNKSDLIGKSVYIVSEFDPNYKKTGKIIEVLEGAFYNIVVEFPNEKTELFRNNEVRLIES